MEKLSAARLGREIVYYATTADEQTIRLKRLNKWIVENGTDIEVSEDQITLFECLQKAVDTLLLTLTNRRAKQQPLLRKPPN